MGDKNYQELIDWSHDPKNVPEWEDPEGSRLPISLNKILEGAGYSREEATEAVQELESIDAAIAYFAV